MMALEDDMKLLGEIPAPVSSLFSEGNENRFRPEKFVTQPETITPADVRMFKRLHGEQQDQIEALNEATAQLMEKETFDSLDELLAEAVHAQGSAVLANEARRKLRFQKEKLSRVEVEELELQIERYELVQNWEVVGAAVAFTRTVCECGKQHTVFEALLERQRHRREQGSLRWHKVRAVPPFTPKEVIFHEVLVPLCAECAFDKGWDLRNGEVKAYERY